MKKAVLIFFILTNSLLISQSGSFGIGDAKSLGMGNTRNSSSLGLTGLASNPAMLDLRKGKHRLEILLPSASILGYSNSLSLEDINFYFGGVDGRGRILTENDKNSLLNAFKNDGTVFLNIVPIQLGISRQLGDRLGTLGFAVNESFSGNLTFPKELADLALNGNEVGMTYNFNKLNFQAWHVRSYDLSYALKLTESQKIKLYGGLTLKYLSGLGWSKLEKVESSFTTSDKHALTGNFSATVQTSLSGNYKVRYDFDSLGTNPSGTVFAPAPVGSGFGASFGFLAMIDSNLKIGVSLTNLGSIKWTKYNAEYSYWANVKVDDLLDRKQLDSLFSSMHSTGKFIGEINTALPLALRFGLSYTTPQKISILPGLTSFALDFNQGLNDSPSNSTKPQFSFGVAQELGEYLPDVLTGFYNDISGNWHLSLGMGYSLSFVEVYLSTGDILSLTGISKTNTLSGGFTMVWKLF